MPFLHFETSDGYDKMSKAMLEAMQEKQRAGENQVPKEKPKTDEQTKANEKRGGKNTTRKMGNVQQSNKTEKDQAAGQHENESLAAEGNSTSRNEEAGAGAGAGSGSGVSSDVTKGPLSSTSQKGTTLQERTTNPAKSTLDEPPIHLAEKTSSDRKSAGSRADGVDKMRPKAFSDLKDQKKEIGHAALQGSEKTRGEITMEANSEKAPAARLNPSGELNLGFLDLNINLILEDLHEDLYSASDGPRPSTSELTPSDGNAQNMPKREDHPAPNFVLTSDPDRTIFDFPRPEEISSPPIEADIAENGTGASAPIKIIQTELHHDKEKQPTDKSVEHVPHKKPIRFKDAVGRKFSFPYDTCRTWAVSRSNILSNHIILSLMLGNGGFDSTSFFGRRKPPFTCQ